MSNATPNRVRVAGFVKNTTSSTPPSLTDASQNTAFKNQVVTVGSESYFVDSTGVAVKLGGSAAATADIPAAIAIGTQAQLTALTEKPTGGKYIVTDGANKGDVLVWADTDGDGVGDTWQVFLAPPALVNQAQWTVLTNATGEPAGVYTYDSASDTWTKTAEVSPVIPPVNDTTAVGGVKLPSRRFTARTNSGNIWIQGENVAGIGFSTGASADGRANVSGAGQTGYRVRKTPNTVYSPASPYAEIIGYRPYAVDVQQNQFGAVMVDHKGNLFAKGNDTTFNQYMLGLAAAIEVPSFAPDAVIAASAAKVVRFFLSPGHRSLMIYTSDGRIYMRTNNGNINGNGTTATTLPWKQVSVPVQGYKQLWVESSGSGAAVLANNGDLYFWGANTNNRINGTATTTIVSTPVRVLQNVKSFAADANSVMAILNDGTRVGVGANTNGKLGNGGTTALTTYTALPGNGFTFESVVGTDDTAQHNSYYYITTDKKAVMTGLQNLCRGIAGKTAADNVVTPTLMGTGAYQGTVVDIHPHINTTYLLTDQGTMWSASRYANYGETGWGLTSIVGTDVGLNVFRRVPVPGTVVKFVTTSESTYNIPGIVAQTSEGKLFHWSGYNSDVDGGTDYRYAPVELEVQAYRQDEPKDSEVVDLFA